MQNKTEGVLENIDEKLTFDYLVNTGLYVINPSIIKYISDDKYFDMPQLIETAKIMEIQLECFQLMKHNGWMLANGKNMRKLNLD